MEPATSSNGEKNGCTSKTIDSDAKFTSKTSNKKGWGFISSFREYFSEEVNRGYELDADESNKTKFAERRERVYAFLLLPIEMEPFMTFGTLQCLDAFLYMFTFLPLRCALVCAQLAVHPLRTLGHKLSPAYTIDLLKLVIVASSFYIMSFVDMSALYHTIRLQAVIKLYIFFNMLDVCDRLLSSVGQDILDALFWTATERVSRARLLLTVQHLALAIGYVAAHTFVVLLQAVTLNVAFNSQNKALITIMLSNNFVEIKGSVFKRFTKNNLFQMACADVRERFHYVVLAIVVVMRNLSAYAWSFERELLEPLLEDTLCVIVFEVVVDWIKHAFIAKFNELPRECYRDYRASLAYDLKNSRERCASDQSDLVSRRMGFIPLPLACLVLLVTQTAPIFQTTEFDLACVQYVFSYVNALVAVIGLELPAFIISTLYDAASASLSFAIPAFKCLVAFVVTLVIRTCVAILIRRIAYSTIETYEEEMAKRASAAQGERDRAKQTDEANGETFLVQRGVPSGFHRRSHSDSFSIDQLAAMRRRETLSRSEPPADRISEPNRRSLPHEVPLSTNVQTSTPPPDSVVPEPLEDTRSRRASAYARLVDTNANAAPTNQPDNPDPFPSHERTALHHSSDSINTNTTSSVSHQVGSLTKRRHERLSDGSINDYSQITMSRPVSTTTLNLDLYCEHDDLPQPQLLMDTVAQQQTDHDADLSKSDSEEQHDDLKVPTRVRRRLFSTISEQQAANDDDGHVREAENEDLPSLTSTPARRGRSTTQNSTDRERAVPGAGDVQSNADADATICNELPTAIERFSMTRAGIV